MIPDVSMLLILLAIGAGVGFVGGLVARTGLQPFQNIGLGIAGALIAGTQVPERIVSKDMFGSLQATAIGWGVIGALLTVAVFAIFNQLTESKGN